MFNPKIGDTLLRITPPYGESEGYSQAGSVIDVTDETIVLTVLVDIPRKMTFSRTNGFDTVGLGTFLVRPSSLD